MVPNLFQFRPFFVVTECVHPNSFPNCSSFAPPASVQDIHINQKLVENESKLILEVKWKIPKAG